MTFDAMEHTAQWGSREAARIQRDFIDGRVNVLSCSTTFELGVDVGDLQSVVMRNMPPKTANYVQRAGRAGRRADAAALVVTYANRASHDLAKYQYPESMIAGHMRIPWIPVTTRESPADMLTRSPSPHTSGIARRSTDKFAGEFFQPAAEGEPSPASKIRDFLNPVSPHIDQALKAALPPEVHAEIGIRDGSWVDHLDRLLKVVELDFSTAVDLFREMIAAAVAVEDFRQSARLKETLRTIQSRDLLGFLRIETFCPSMGFP